VRLTLQTDYALRSLVYLATSSEGSAPAAKIADAYGVSLNHLVKVLQKLRALGYVETVRGRNGGVRLSRDPALMRLGDVVRGCEDLTEFVECFRPETNTCPLAGACLLKARLGEALAAYLRVLDGYTIADVAANRAELSAILGTR
jgi:Rrf2 family nitric oxide-sensitive transcriptional repressor